MNGNVRAAGAIVVQGNAVIQGQQHPNSAPALTPMVVPAGATVLGNVTVSNGQVYNLSAGDYVANSILLEGTGSLSVVGEGRVRLWFTALTVRGNATASAAYPDQLWFVGNGATGTVSLGGHGLLTSVIYAPGHEVTIYGDTQLHGAVVGGTVLLLGNDMVHFDEDLGGCSGGGGGGMISAFRSNLKARTEGPPTAASLLTVPNPSRGRATCWVKLPKCQRSRLLLSGLDGSLLQQIELGAREEGWAVSELDLRHLASGTYLLVAQADEGTGLVTTGRFKVALIH